MKVLVIGQGGREHALCWKLKQSPRLSALFCAPGNPGTAGLGNNVPIRGDNIPALIDFARQEAIDLTVVGPEDPLVQGLVDEFEAAGLHVFGPRRAAAQLEGSKRFAKEIMQLAGVPTAAYRAFRDVESALAYVQQRPGPSVVKADGLAAGKGVVVCDDSAAAAKAVPEVFNRFRCSEIVIEERLNGREASFIAATDGDRIVPLAASHDYKRVRDRDEGPNTGGMGTVSPTPHLTASEEQWVMAHVIDPVIKLMRERGTPFRGFLYAGLMISPQREIKVLEFNVRLGDPETQVILRRMDADLLELLAALSFGKPLPPITAARNAAVCLVLAAEGYPDKPRAGDAIAGIAEANALPDVEVFHAGTVTDSAGRLLTSGGRVLNVTAAGSNVAEARAKAYRAVELVKFDGRHYRQDIGAA